MESKERIDMYKANDVVVNRRGDVVVLKSSADIDFPLYYHLHDEITQTIDDYGRNYKDGKTSEYDIVGYAKMTPKDDESKSDGYAIKPNPESTSPTHYSRLSPQPIDVISSWGLNFNLGNAVKYIARAGFKSDKATDLKKAIAYLQHELDKL
jgi:Protein of unknwon function (DUF3310)